MKIAIIGLGVVGRGVYDIVTRDLAPEIEVKYVLDLRELEDITSVHAQNIDEITADPEVTLVVEAMGGLHPAAEFVKKALAAGKHVVTPNKQLVSTLYSELNDLARAHGARLLYTPSAGGGIPWLYNLVRTKRCGGIRSFHGIINGTTNYILDAMETTGRPFADILANAQHLGYAEADPSADIDGIDVQRKCAISANLAFGVQLEPAAIDTAGIRYLQREDVAAFAAAGLRCKLLCSGEKRVDGRISAWVMPVLLRCSEIEANVGTNFNMMLLTGPTVGELGFYGQGAGRYPTAQSLVEDILDVRDGGSYCWEGAPAAVDNSSAVFRYYVRSAAPDWDRLAESRMGKGLVTAPLPVAEMHAMVRRVLEQGTPVFFAALQN